MMGALGGDLRAVGDDQHLHPACEFLQPPTHGLGRCPAHACVDLVKHQRRQRVVVGQRHLECQQEARQLPARGGLLDAGEGGSGVGRGGEGHCVHPQCAAAFSVTDNLGSEFCLLKLQDRQLGHDRLIQPRGRLASGRAQKVGGFVELRPRPHQRGFERIHMGAAVIQRFQPPTETLKQRRQIVGCAAVLARKFAVAEQPVFNLRQRGRIGLQRLLDRLQLRQRFVHFHRRTVNRCQGRLQRFATASLSGAFKRAIGLIEAGIGTLTGRITALAPGTAAATVASTTPTTIEGVCSLLDRFLDPGHVGE